VILNKLLPSLLMVVILLLAACQSDGYMGRSCEGKNLSKGSAEYEACVEREARRNRYEVNKYSNGGP